MCSGLGVPLGLVLLFLCVFYGLFVFVALTNIALMRRAQPGLAGDWNPAICIPARNEAKNLPDLLGPLRDQGAKIFVFDDDSSDGTGEIASSFGAQVIRSRTPLPEGWTGKNRACHELAKVVAEVHDGEWIVFLDADTKPGPTFLKSLGHAVIQARTSVATGMPKIIPGRGFEPVYLGWVGWIIAATNPFGLVALTRKGHNRFMNGQIGVWRSSTYFEFMPHETMKGEVLEDVMIGRLMAAKNQPVAVLDVSEILSVAMYEDYKSALDGMSKNTCFIAGNDFGTILIGLFLLFTAWAWVLAWPAVFLLLLSKAIVDSRAKFPIWTLPLMPITLTMGAYTCLRSVVWKRQGKIVWKGRTYV